MKKMIALALVLIMAVACLTAAFAVENSSVKNNGSFAVCRYKFSSFSVNDDCFYICIAGIIGVPEEFCSGNILK